MRTFGKDLGVSHASVSYWVSGKMEPDTDFLIHLLNDFQDWRHDFANSILCIRLPETFKPNGNGHNPDPNPCEETKQ